METVKRAERRRDPSAFALTDLLVVIASASVLLAVLTPIVIRIRAKSKLEQCRANLGQVSRAILLYADDNQKRLPAVNSTASIGVWWMYKEQVKGFVGLKEK